MKPGKKWVVDGEIFETYTEACAHVRKNKFTIERNNLVNDLRKILRDQPYSGATENSADDIATALLRLYEMKRK